MGVPVTEGRRAGNRVLPLWGFLGNMNRGMLVPEGRTAMAISDADVERFRILREDFLGDTAAATREQEVDRKRHAVIGEMLPLLRHYLASEIDNEEFRATFDSKTRREWTGFGFKGPSGAMFLNMLVKYVPDQDALAEQLRGTLRLPGDTEAGKEAMRGFVDCITSAVCNDVAV